MNAFSEYTTGIITGALLLGFVALSGYIGFESVTHVNPTDMSNAFLEGVKIAPIAFGAAVGLGTPIGVGLALRGRKNSSNSK